MRAITVEQKKGENARIIEQTWRPPTVTKQTFNIDLVKAR